MMPSSIPSRNALFISFCARLIFFFTSLFHFMKKISCPHFLNHHTRTCTMNQLQNLAAPIGRLFLALIFIIMGFSKIGSFAATQGWMESAGVPGALLPAVIALEVLGGLAILVGWRTRIVALLLAGFSLLTAVVFHADFADQNQFIAFLKNVALAGGFLMIVAQGAGSFSLDNRRWTTTAPAGLQHA
jgi:putative oxidoreductase